MKFNHQNTIITPSDIKESNNSLKVNKRAINICAGDKICLTYLIIENGKERTQTIEGIILSVQNSGINQTFTLRRYIQNLGLEQIFFVHSPKILSMVKEQHIKTRRSKLYFLRSFSKQAFHEKLQTSNLHLAGFEPAKPLRE